MTRTKKPKVAGVDEIGRVCAYATQQCLQPEGCVQREAGLIAGDAAAIELIGLNCSMHGGYLSVFEVQRGRLRRNNVGPSSRARAREKRIGELADQLKARAGRGPRGDVVAEAIAFAETQGCDEGVTPMH